ncbi:hypothetical protein OAC83_00455 [Flavobacteriales bacterium]|nr:hypothetical protein [Flavobacteriales bacterium]MDB9910072.1 hypothetical protein [Flavobacteriales bacterium]
MEIKKTLSTLLSILFCVITFAQSVPQGINYQAVARDASGAVLMNQALTIQFSIISDITTSAVSWQETHSVSTNDYGLYTAIIGEGTSTSVGSSAAFDSINWGVSNHLLKVEVNYGNGLVDMGTTAFMSVPYSIYSANPGPPGIDGTNGTAGDGVQFAYLDNNSSSAPSTPTAIGTGGWTAAPTGVTISNQYEWVSQRTSTNGTFGSFSTPAIFANYAEDGTSGGGANGAATSETFYVTFQAGQDKKVNSDPLYDDGIVRFGWDAPGNDIEFYLIPGSEPPGINPATGFPWGPIPSPGIGTPSNGLSANVWNNDSGLPSVSTFVFPGVIYDLMPAGVFGLERASGTISPYYYQANPHNAPNFFDGYNPTNSYIGEGPPFPTYNFIYHNLDGSDNVTLQITRISNE